MNNIKRKSIKFVSLLVVSSLVIGCGSSDSTTTNDEDVEIEQTSDTNASEPQIALEETITHNGIEYDKVTSDLTQRVWLDRNLGATEVCTSLDDKNCFGDYYQWG